MSGNNHGSGTEIKGRFLSKKSLKITAISLLAVINTIIFTALMLSMDTINENAAAFGLITNELIYSEEERGFFVQKGKNMELIPAEVSGAVGYSIDKATAAFLSEDKKLQVIYKNKKIDIEENVYSFKLSENGASVVYFTEYDFGTGNAVLNLYLIKNGKTFRFSDAVRFQENEDICISPDGRTIAYMSNYNKDDGWFTGYSYMAGGEPEEIGINKMCMEISNVASLIYYADVDISKEDAVKGLYVKKGSKETKLMDSLVESQALYLNNEHTQLLYTANGSAYICDNGDTPYKIADIPEFSLLSPYNSQNRTNTFTVLNTRNFKYKYLLSGTSLYYTGKYYDGSLISSDVGLGGALISQDSKISVHIGGAGDSQKLYCIKSGGEKIEIQQIGTPVLLEVSNGAFKCINAEGEIYYSDSGENFEKVSEMPNSSSATVK